MIAVKRLSSISHVTLWGNCVWNWQNLCFNNVPFQYGIVCKYNYQIFGLCKPWLKKLIKNLGTWLSNPLFKPISFMTGKFCLTCKILSVIFKMELTIIALSIGGNYNEYGIKRHIIFKVFFYIRISRYIRYLRQHFCNISYLKTVYIP